MADKKIKFVVSKVHGLTLSTKQGNSAVLNPGEQHRASELTDDFVERLEEGNKRELELASLVELSPKEAFGEAAEQEVIGPDTDPDDEDEDDLYDPSDYTVAEVLEYLKDADAQEVERVKAAEAATSRNSTQVADYQPAPQE